MDGAVHSSSPPETPRVIIPHKQPRRVAAEVWLMPPIPVCVCVFFFSVSSPERVCCCRDVFGFIPTEPYVGKIFPIPTLSMICARWFGADIFPICTMYDTMYTIHRSCWRVGATFICIVYGSSTTRCSGLDLYHTDPLDIS